MWWVWVVRACGDIICLRCPPHNFNLPFKLYGAQQTWPLTQRSRLPMHSLYAGWHAAPGQAQLVFGKSMWQDVQATAAITKKMSSYKPLNLQFSWKLKNLQQLHFDFITRNFCPKLFSSRNIVTTTQTSLFAQRKHHQQNASPTTMPKSSCKN